jgi:alanyl-tRNA synthetase
MDIISSCSWNISLIDVCRWHSDYLKPQYPELLEHLDEVDEILSAEAKKYDETKRKSMRIVGSLKGKISLDKLITLYDSQGITPPMLVEAGMEIEVPPDFYAKVSLKHEQTAAKAGTKRELELPLKGLEKTEILYFDDYLRLEFKANVVRILDNKYVVLDRTAFYPTSGGQLHDIGTLNGCPVTDTFKQGNIVVHSVKSPDFKEGDNVVGRIDRNRRIQLAQNHTATHIINGVAKEILGSHIWQAGAEKTLQKARLDLTHYETLSQENLNEIERKTNQILADKVPVESTVLKRDRAESLYGFRLYQGGAVPGRELRIVKIGDLDVEACGGTHLHNTGEAGIVKLLGSTKIQDGIVRLEYVSGGAAVVYIKDNVFQAAKELLGELIDSDLLPEYSLTLMKRLTEIEERFNKIVDENGMLENRDFIQTLDEELLKCSQIFSVQVKQLKRTVKRFLNDIKAFREEIKKINGKERLQKPVDLELSKEESIIVMACKTVFSLWKKEKKHLEEKRGRLAKKHFEEKDFEVIGEYKIIVKDIKAGLKGTLKIAKELVSKKNVVVIFGRDKIISVIGVRGEANINMGEIVQRASEMLGGGGGGRPDFGQGAGKDASKLIEAMNLVKKDILKSLKNES